MYGAGLVGLILALSLMGLRYSACYAGASLPEHVVADMAVPLAQSQDRTLYAATLVRQGLAHHLGSTLVDRRCLQARGPQSACATGVRNTVDEALVLRRVVEEERFRRVIVVTSADHLARAASVFFIIFAGTGVNIHVVAPSEACPSLDSLAHELLSYVPSVVAAGLARVLPPAYEWSVLRFGPTWSYVVTYRSARQPV